MKIATIFWIWTAFFTITAFGQNTQRKPRDQIAEKELEVAVKELYAAMVNKNEAGLKKWTAEQLDYGHSSGTLENKSKFMKAVMTGDFDYISIEPQEQRISVSGDTGIVRHVFMSTGTKKGEPTEVRIGNLMTFQKQRGRWRLLARQAYKL